MSNTSTGPRLRTACASLLVGYALIAAVPSCPAQTTHSVTVNADGSFTPQHLFIGNGDAVEWHLNTVLDSIIPVGGQSGQDICSAYKPYHPNGANEFTGPMGRAISGVFALGPDGPGFVGRSGAQCEDCRPENEACPVVVGSGATSQCLRRTGEPYAAMSSTWGDPDMIGVFIRLDWNAVHKGPGRYEWDALDREIQQAIDKGKLYSLSFRAGIHGTPTWIFAPWSLPPGPPSAPPLSTQPGGAPQLDPLSPAVERLRFQDGGSKLKPGNCGWDMDLGSPADEAYREYYFAMLTKVAEHIKEKNAWYRALAYIKPSGMNLFSAENRLPNSCEKNQQDCLCNTEVWAKAKEKNKERRYTPTALRQFYQEQMKLLAREFPDKDMSYMLIQAGFPQVNDSGEYLGQPDPVNVLAAQDVPDDKCDFPGKGVLPNGTQQTECVIQDGTNKYKTRLAIQHNGLGPLCGDGDDKDALDDCLPNRWARNAGDAGQIIGYQTNNWTLVGDGVQLEAAFQNGYCNSLATFFEIYEERLWEIRNTTGGVLDPSGSSIIGCKLPIPPYRTLGSWAALLHGRRTVRGAGLKLPDAFPMTHLHRAFERTIGVDPQAFTYVHGSRCAPGKFGTLTIVSEISPTQVAGYDRIGPIQKPTPATVKSLPGVTPDTTSALTEMTLWEAGGKSCDLSLSFRPLPGQTGTGSGLALNASLSGPGTCRSGTKLGTAKFDDLQDFVRGVRVCTSGAIPRLKGVEVFAGKVAADGAVSLDARPSQRFTAGDCTWSTARYCPSGEVAVGVLSYFTDGGGFSGIALQCRAFRAS